MRRRAFTLVELVVALGLLALVVALAAVIFRVALGSYRLAGAHAEILGKLRIVTQQLDRDFAGLRRDGPVFVGWVVEDDPQQADGLRSWDRMLFFSQGREVLHAVGGSRTSKPEGNLARIVYQLVPGDSNSPRDTLLTRTQHLLIPPSGAPTLPDPNDRADWSRWHNDPNRAYDDRYDRLQRWWTMDPARLRDAVAGMTDMDPNTRALLGRYGTQVDMNDPGRSLHQMWCQGVGQFRIQGWYDDGTSPRWVPDPNSDLLDHSGGAEADRSGSLLYPADPPGDPNRVADGFVHLGGVFGGQTYADRLNPQTWSRIPGLGRALRFTFTLYDTHGLLPHGMTFTHIVYLDR